MMRFVSFAILAVLAAVGAALPIAPACAPAPAPGQSVDVAEETALIVWDEANKTEHFLRQAKFQSTSADFGFLVPTPSQPKLTESNEEIFGELATITAPKVEFRTVRKARDKSPAAKSDAALAGGQGAAAAPRGVEVLDQTDIGGYEATVLKFHRGKANDVAADAQELAAWLQKHGYELGPQLTDWLKPYIENDWVITAFRVAKTVPISTNKPRPAGPQELQLKPIWMSFKTDRPFYPYREPTAKKDDAKPAIPQAPRLLRVFVLAKERVSATLGKGSTAWVANAVWSDKADAEPLKKAAAVGKLPDGALAENAWLTEFEDRSAPRNGIDEVYFSPSTDKAAIHRPPIVHEIVEYYDPPGTPEYMKVAVIAGLIVLAAAFVFYLVLIFRTPKERPV